MAKGSCTTSREHVVDLYLMKWWVAYTDLTQQLDTGIIMIRQVKSACYDVDKYTVKLLSVWFRYGKPERKLREALFVIVME